MVVITLEGKVQLTCRLLFRLPASFSRRESCRTVTANFLAEQESHLPYFFVCLAVSDFRFVSVVMSLLISPLFSLCIFDRFLSFVIIHVTTLGMNVRTRVMRVLQYCVRILPGMCLTRFFPGFPSSFCL